jgi:hypothetical protein
MRKGIVKETLAVGASLTAAHLGLRWAANKAGVLDKIPFPVFIFAAGAITHLGWEVTGGNKWFAENYPKTVSGLDITEAMRRARKGGR